MPYQHDERARREAAAHPVADDGAEQLAVLCARSLNKLGEDGLRGHAASFRGDAWLGLPGAVEALSVGDRLTRGDLLDMGERVRAGDLSPVTLLAASFAWGTGRAGYGPARYRQIAYAAGEGLERSLRRALQVVYQESESPDLIGGYAQLYGGYEPGLRGRPGGAPWGRLRGLGPAFFTKFLYFTVQGALILDNRVANAVRDLSGLPHLVTAGRRSVAWTPYRYAVYLHWMRQTAQMISVQPDALEYALFSVPTGRPAR